jgi:hypothetical protein
VLCSRHRAGRQRPLAVLGKTVALAFDGAADGVYLSLCNQDSAEFSKPVRVDSAAPGTSASGVAVAAAPDGKSAWISWIEKAGEKRSVCVRRAALKE